MMKPIRVEDRNEIEKIYRQRYRIFGEECNFFNIEDFPDKMEYDEYDRYCEYYAVYDNDRIIMSTRFIVDSPIGYPTSNIYNIDQYLKDFKNSEIAEFSRMIIEPEYRNLKNTIDLFKNNLDMLKNRCIEKDIKIIIGSYEYSFIKLLSLVGIDFDVVGKPKIYLGVDRVPAIFDPQSFNKD